MFTLKIILISVIYFKMGKDGRVRPVSNQYFRQNNNCLNNLTSNNFQDWLPLVNSTSCSVSEQQAQITSESYEETTTIFPVNASGSVIKTTTTKSGSCLLGGSSSSNTTLKVYPKNEEDSSKLNSSKPHLEVQMKETEKKTMSWKVN